MGEEPRDGEEKTREKKVDKNETNSDQIRRRIKEIVPVNNSILVQNVLVNILLY